MSIYCMNKVWGMEGVSQAEMLLLLALADRANDDNVCWPGQASLAKKCNTTERTIRRTLKSLESKNLLTITARQGDGEGRKTNVYTLTLDGKTDKDIGQPDNMSGGGNRTNHAGQPDISDRQPDISGRATGRIGPPIHHYIPQIDTSLDTSDNNVPKKRITKPQSFKDFFAAYPANRKGGTDQVAWNKAKKLRLTDDDFKLMIVDIHNRQQHDEKWQGGFIQGIAKYLEEHTWLTPITMNEKAVNKAQRDLEAEAWANGMDSSSDVVATQEKGVISHG